MPVILEASKENKDLIRITQKARKVTYAMRDPSPCGLSFALCRYCTILQELAGQEFHSVAWQNQRPKYDEFWMWIIFEGQGM